MANPPSREQRPLRKVVKRLCGLQPPYRDKLECGHYEEPSKGWSPRAPVPKRRRCSTCPPVLPQEKP